MPTKNIAPNMIKINQHQAGEINLFKEKFITSYFEKKTKNFFMLQLTKFGDCIEIAMFIFLKTILFK